ncbi:protein dehydration-induced [Sesamum angolense]|uniref:Protein dehydration-induced n=1 Tax=Sesamum angolense TaxID=2727404 RepID=A0AAE2C2S9_9LAMI|nr:protein dehydration-induced [Sesamum angolense]
MGDRFYDDLEIALSSYSIPSIDDYNEEEEETEGEYEGEEVNDAQNEEKSEELACPFCLEDFDVLGLCCHIDADHRMEVKPRICPVCAAKVGINMASHFYHFSAIFLTSNLLALMSCSSKESTCVDSSSDAAADSMLLSFVNNPEPACRPQIIETISPTETSLWQSSAEERYAGNAFFLSRFQYYCTESEVNVNMISKLVYALLFSPFGN